MAEEANPAPDAPADADADAKSPEGTAPAAPAPDAPEAPPWGDDFDAERAWKTIQTLRASEKELKDLKRSQEKAAQEKADAEKTEIERLTDRLTAAEEALKARDREALVAKVAKEKGVPDDLVDFLTGDTEESLSAQAERLASKVKAPAVDLPGKPKPRLTPGTGSDDAPADDPVAIAARIRASA